MHKFVSPSQQKGYVNYDDMVKYLAKCMGDSASYVESKPNYDYSNTYPSNSVVATAVGTVSAAPGYYQTAPPQYPPMHHPNGQPMTQSQINQMYNSPNIVQMNRP